MFFLQRTQERSNVIAGISDRERNQEDVRIFTNVTAEREKEDLRKNPKAVAKNTEYNSAEIQNEGCMMLISRIIKKLPI